MSESDAELLFFMQLARRQRVHDIASAAFLVWDLITTLDEEVSNGSPSFSADCIDPEDCSPSLKVEYIWGSANTLPKYLYFISRYLGLFGQLVVSTNLVPMFCFDYLVLSFGFLFTLILSVELSLMLRIDALYGKSRKVRLLMGFGFFAEIAVRLFPIVAFETVLFLLNIAKCISYAPLDHTPLIYRLFRDGSLYFIITTVFMASCTIAQYLDSEAASSLVVWMSVVFSYSGCHLLLSLRKIAARRQRLEISQIFSADIPLVHAASGTTESSSLGPEIHPLPSRLSSASRVRPSVQVDVDMIELVPRQGLSPILATPSPTAEGSHEETPYFDYTRDWDIVHPGSEPSRGDRVERTRSRGGRSENRDGGPLWLQRWTPR
ncbi:hypothetical protein GSI_14869 [Ganoderma sinense ZZ0214-1]|uniref:DUF6533 domain-containing protein n=1 Tax=Ganoderma sinense ZZ0214-1 TaxID=1077348 RepID=A0A2G8RPX7_9APHY|nr:hypothetical protein GSI_14869 [Ganoderma sinense ZZ0214-1]